MGKRYLALFLARRPFDLKESKRIELIFKN